MTRNLSKRIEVAFPVFNPQFQNLLIDELNLQLHDGKKTTTIGYNENLPMEQRTGINTSNSFFSGHTSTTAVSCFFFAKIYSDHHNLKKWQKTMLFAGAAVPPAVVGYYRMKGGKHFRTDVLAGIAVGAATGILIPELHKKKPKNLSIIPVRSKECSGLALNYTF